MVHGVSHPREPETRAPPTSSWEQQQLVSGHSPSKKIKILLVDDSVEEIFLVKTLIEDAGPYQVATAQDGHEGLELLLAGGWQLALVDLTLPGPDGIELIQQAKEEYPTLPIMAITRSTSSLMIDGAFRAGAEYVLNKPIDRDELLSKVREFVTLEGEGEGGPGEAAVDVTATGHVPTVVAVGGRPGDVEMGCGGVLFKHRAEGHQVVILNLAGGGDPHSDLAAAAVQAAGMLGGEVKSVGDEDDDAVDPEAATELLRSVMAETGPGMLYLPTASAQDQSSVESNRIALASAEAVPNVLAYQCPTATLDFRPQLFVDVGPFMARKTEMLNFYTKLGLANVGPELAAATARYWGRFMDPEEIEPLEVIRRGGA